MNLARICACPRNCKNRVEGTARYCEHGDVHGRELLVDEQPACDCTDCCGNEALSSDYSHADRLRLRCAKPDCGETDSTKFRWKVRDRHRRTLLDNDPSECPPRCMPCIQQEVRDREGAQRKQADELPIRCLGCGNEFPLAHYRSSQRNKAEHKRRCQECAARRAK